MSSSEDSTDYRLTHYKNNKKAPFSIKKKMRLFAAVARNRVDRFKILLSSPKWYAVKDKAGSSLLEIAILQNNKEIFDYMLSIPKFPLDLVNKKGQTALTVALGHKCNNEYFAFELVRKGASFKEDSLYCAIKKSYHHVAKLLLKKGAGVDNLNHLELALAANAYDTVLALLFYGATPSVASFQTSVLNNSPFLIQELLFLHTFDEFANVEINLAVVLKLAETESLMFWELMKCPVKILLDDNIYPTCYYIMWSLKKDFLAEILKRIVTVQRPSSFRKHSYYSSFNNYFRRNLSIDNISMTLESVFKHEVIDFIGTINGCHLLSFLVTNGHDESTITKFFCFLLSYGFEMDEDDLCAIYDRSYCGFGFCQLFEILLHMDIKKSSEDDFCRHVMGTLISNVTMDLDKIFRHPYKYDRYQDLMDFFADPKLRRFLLEWNGEGAKLDVSRMPKVPALLQSARDVFRRHFIKTFKIRTAKEFFTWLNKLNVPLAHKEIICYKRKIY